MMHRFPCQDAYASNRWINFLAARYCSYIVRSSSLEKVAEAAKNPAKMLVSAQGNWLHQKGQFGGRLLHNQPATKRGRFSPASVLYCLFRKTNWSLSLLSS